MSKPHEVLSKPWCVDVVAKPREVVSKPRYVLVSKLWCCEGVGALRCCTEEKVVAVGCWSGLEMISWMSVPPPGGVGGGFPVDGVARGRDGTSPAYTLWPLVKIVAVVLQ